VATTETDNRDAMVEMAGSEIEMLRLRNLALRQIIEETVEALEMHNLKTTATHLRKRLDEVLHV